MRNKRLQVRGISMLTRAALVLACWALLPTRLTVALVVLVLILWFADRRTLGGMLLAHALERRLNRPQRPVVVQTTRAAPIRPARVERLSQRRIRARPAPRLRALPPVHPQRGALVLRSPASTLAAQAMPARWLRSTDCARPGNRRKLLLDKRAARLLVSR
jgi:hypothetical protein